MTHVSGARAAEGVAAGTLAGVPRWTTQFKKQGRALAGHLLCVIGLLLVPGLIAEIHNRLADAAWTARHSYTVQFSAMPEAYRTGAGFALETADQRAKVQCVPLRPAGDPQLSGYRCDAVQLNPQSNLSGRYDFFPVSQGWAPVDRRDTDFELEPPEVNAIGWEALFTLLAVALYWRGRRFVHERTKCSALVGLGWCALVVASAEFINWGLSPWMDTTEAAPSNATLLTVVSLVVLAPVLEELVFRGFGWRLLQPAFPLWMVVVVTTMTFTVGHGYGWAGHLILLASGLGLAWLRIRTGSVGWCIVVHAAMNALVLAYNAYNS